MTGIIFAMEIEAQPFLKLLTSKKQFIYAGKKCFLGKIYGSDVCIIISDIGKVNASSAAQALICRYKKLSLILNIGVTGAVNPALKICDICVAEKTMQYDFDVTAIDSVPVGYIQNMNRQYFYCDKNLYSKFMAIFNRSITVATADRFSTKKEEAEFILSLGGDVRDMELGSIAQVCILNNIPFISLKSISDTTQGDASQDFKENLIKSTECFALYAEKIFGVIDNG